MSDPAAGGLRDERALERALVERSRAGDTRAFRGLVERHQSSSYRLALRILRSESDAEEVVQDAFVRAWLGIREFRGEAAFGTWLYRIVARRAFDRAAQLRARESRERALTDHDAGVAREGPAGTAEGARAPGARTRPRIMDLLDGLPPAQREALSLYYFEDLPVAQIARTLGIPEGTVKTNLSRGRAALRRAWKRLAAGEARSAEARWEDRTLGL